MYTRIKVQWQRDGMTLNLGIKLCCNSESRETLVGQLNVILADKTALGSFSVLPWPSCCPSAAACCLLDGGNAIVCGTLCVSDPWSSPGQKENLQIKRLLSLFLFVWLLFNADLPNLVHEMIPQAVVLAHLKECGSRHKGLKGSGGRAAHFATKEHIPCN